MKRRGIVLALAAALTLTVSAAAYQVPNLETQITEPYYGLNTDPQDQAEFLHALGLFRGTEEGYALDRSMTRSEAAVMLVRLLGQEDAALTQSPSHPFTDVPQWASPYVGWLWTNGLTKGASATTFGASSAVTAKQYLMFLSRALYGPDVADDYWELGWGFDLTTLQQSLDQAGFLRRDAVSLSVLALSQNTDSGDTLAAKLVADGVFTAEQFQTPSLSVFSSLYQTTESGTPCRTTAGVSYTGTETGLTYLYESDTAPHDYFLTTRQSDSGTELCAIDCATLELTATPAALPLAAGQRLSYEAGTVNGDYLLIETESGSPAAVLYYDGAQVQQLLDLVPLCDALESPYCVWESAGGGCLLTLQDRSTAVRYSWQMDGPTATALPTLDNQDVIEMLDDSVIVQQSTAGQTILQQVTLSTGTVLARFELPHTEDSPFPDPVTGGKQMIARTLTDKTGCFYWGQAGLYQVEDGVLRCLLDRPVDDLMLLEDGSLYLLTHTSGYLATLDPSFVQNRYPGNEILYRSPDGNWSTALSADCDHNIAITDLEGLDETGALGFTCQTPIKQNSDGIRYRLIRSGTSPSIRVESVWLAYPETQVPVEQIPAYYEQLRQQEQQRLNDLGLGIVETP